MLTPAPTLTLATAVLPNESVTFTTSVWFGVGPAVYAPVPATMLPPEGADCIVQVYPVPLPPLALKLTAPLGAALALTGLTLTPAPMVMPIVALFPYE